MQLFIHSTRRKDLRQWQICKGLLLPRSPSWPLTGLALVHLGSTERRLWNFRGSLERHPTVYRTASSFIHIYLMINLRVFMIVLILGFHEISRDFCIQTSIIDTPMWTLWACHTACFHGPQLFTGSASKPLGQPTMVRVVPDWEFVSWVY